MAVPVVPHQDPEQTSILYEYIASPYSPGWWTTSTVTNIPNDSVGWLLAQGWTITDITFDTSTQPATPSYAMSRQSLQNWTILQGLLDAWTYAYNLANQNNTIRYNDVVENWAQMIDSTQDQFIAQTAEQNSQATLFLANLEVYMDAVDVLIGQNAAQVVVDAEEVGAALAVLDSKLSDLETNASANATTIGGLLTNQTSYLSTFLTDFAAKLAELDTNYAAHLIVIEGLLTEADLDLSAFQDSQTAELANLQAAYSSHLSELDDLLASAGAYLTDIAGDVNAILASMESDYTSLDSDITALLSSGTTSLDSFADDYEAVLDLLETDYTLHSATATAFLTDLGSTELARINEAFAASLSTQLQQLSDRGYYSSQAAADITARNTRDKNEEIAALNDRLNREKFENQHRLYGQQTAMRTGRLSGKDRLHSVRQEVTRYQASQITGLYQLLQSMRDRTLGAKTGLYALRDANVKLNIETESRLYDAGQALRRVLIEEAARLNQLQQAITQWNVGQRDRLLEQIQGIVAQRAAGIDRQHALQQEISRVAMSERDTLFGQLQDAAKGIIAGKDRYASLLMQNASTLAEHRHKIIVEKMNETAVRLEGLQTQHTDNMKLLAYQLDERNKLLVGLYGFVERRDDVAPSFEMLTQMAAGLGDAGGGWVTP